MSPAEFIRVSYIETGHTTEKSLQDAGLSGVLDGSAEIDLALAKRLSEVVGRSQQSWIRMQQNYLSLD
jgi:plasmid maintenance system antidote protein VapI